MRLVVVAGTTRTAGIGGISAAGADPDAAVYTPSADAEIVVYGRPVRTPGAPVSPSGCPTPAVATRAVRELAGFEPVIVDAGLAAPTAAPTVDVGAGPGRDVREADAVPDASSLFERARDIGRSLPDDELAIGETIPGGTTTALAVLTALGERASVSSSLPENPLARKSAVVDDALAASDLEPGGATGQPFAAVRQVGDPVLATAAGLVVGATRTGTSVRLAGGTQMATVGALVRHHGIEEPLSLESTSFVAADESADLRAMATDLDLDLTVTDPGFDAVDHSATEAYVRGAAKEGVGMGGALAMAARSEVSMTAVRGRFVALADRLMERSPV